MLLRLTPFILLALSAAANAQSSTFQLDEEGRLVQQSAPAPGSDAAVMASVRASLADGRISSARRELDAWLTTYELTSNPYVPEALLLRGDCKLADADEYEALLDYEEVAKNFSGSEQFAPALERQFEVAMLYLGGLRKKVFGLFRMDSGVPIAEDILVRINERLPGSRLAERALLELADYYYRNRDLRGASETYDVFIQNFPNSDARPLAMQRLIYSNIAQFKGPRYDAAPLLDARYQIDTLVQEFPAHAQEAGLGPELQARLDESRAAQVLGVAQWYLKRGDPISARLTLRRLVRTFPGTRSAREGLDIIEKRGWGLGAAESPMPAAEPGEEATPIDPKPSEEPGS